MVTRAPQKSESFVQAIPLQQDGESDNRPLIFSEDGSADEYLKGFQDVKVLYIMLHTEKDEHRPSYITEKKFSTTAAEINQGFEAAMGMLICQDEQSDVTSQKKRQSSICESLKSLRERRLRESVESPRFGHGSRNSSLTKKSSMMLPRDYNDELEMAYTAANIKKIFDKRRRYFSFNESSNHSIENSSDRSGLIPENMKQAGKTPIFANGYNMMRGKDSSPIKNQLRQIATKVKDDNFSFRSSSRGSNRNARKIEMSFYRHWKKKQNMGVKKTRKYSDNQQVVEKPLKAYSPKKYAGNLSASSYDSSCSSCENNHKVKLQKHFRNVVIQEEQDDTESKKESKLESNTERRADLESYNETSSYQPEVFSPGSKQQSEESEFTNRLKDCLFPIGEESKRSGFTKSHGSEYEESSVITGGLKGEVTSQKNSNKKRMTRASGKEIDNFTKGMDKVSDSYAHSSIYSPDDKVEAIESNPFKGYKMRRESEQPLESVIEKPKNARKRVRNSDFNDDIITDNPSNDIIENVAMISKNDDSINDENTRD